MSSVPSRQFTIVIADDDLDDQNLLREAFDDSKIKPKIYQVYDGVKLLDLLGRRYEFRTLLEPPDVIFLDLNMPLMGGFDALREIKSHPKYKDIPVYIVTTSKSTKEKDRAIKMGASGFYHKGASPSDIKRIVKEVCLECFG